MSEEYDIFAEFLKTRQLRMTAVRKEIIRHIENTTAEFSVADLQSEILVAGVALNTASLYRNLILLKQAGLVELFPEKKGGKTFFRLKKNLGRIYELHCPGCRKHRQISDPALDSAILGICAQYGLAEDGITVRINARHKRHGKQNEQ